MEISPALGIGDLLIIKMKELSNNLDIKIINVAIQLVFQYKMNPDQYLKFLDNLLPLLFPNAELNHISEASLNYIIEFRIKKTYIYEYINTYNKINIPYENYIIFHCKIRMDDCIDKFIQNDRIVLNNFFENFKTNKTILILGERNVEKNPETLIHNIISIYDDIMQLEKNNKIIDLTRHNLCSGNPSFDDFKFDIELINKADLNITFGWGGPFAITNAFSKNNCSFLGDLPLIQNDSNLADILQINKHCCFTDINQFVEYIGKYFNLKTFYFYNNNQK
jgi:hypothetical protein